VFTEEKMLTVEEVATHFALKPDTVRRKIKSGELDAFKVQRQYRCEWHQVWACEHGKLPKRSNSARYQVALLTKKMIASKLKVGEKTVERWASSGMPTRNVFGAVRYNPHDVTDWLRKKICADLPDKWWLE
jgi:excisionase family DNA binding protein